MAMIFIVAGSVYRYDVPYQQYDKIMATIQDVDGAVLSSTENATKFNDVLLIEIKVPKTDGDYVLTTDLVNDGELKQYKEYIEITKKVYWWQDFMDWLRGLIYGI